MNFEFCVNGQTYAVRTEVGNGLSVVVVQALDPQEALQLEPSEDV